MAPPRSSVPYATPQFIFTFLGIIPVEEWQERNVAWLMQTLRSNAGWRSEEVAQRLSPAIAVNSLWEREKVGAQKNIQEILTVLKPQLIALADAGWLDPSNYTVNMHRYEQVSQACRMWRESRKLHLSALNKALNFNVSEFENYPHKTKNNNLRPLANLISIADRLCTFYNVTLEQFLAGPPIQDIVDAQVIGDSTATILRRRQKTSLESGRGGGS